MIDPLHREPIPEMLWSIIDRWFRILEIGLILGVLCYFKIRTNNFLLSGVYWISWIMFWLWFVEIGEFIASKLSLKKSSAKKWIIWLICVFLAFLFWSLITSITQWIIQQQFN